MMVGSFVNGLMPGCSGVAAFSEIFSLMRPGMVTSPWALSCSDTIALTASIAEAACFLFRPVFSASAERNSDLLIRLPAMFFSLVVCALLHSPGRFGAENRGAASVGQIAALSRAKYTAKWPKTLGGSQVARIWQPGPELPGRSGRDYRELDYRLKPAVPPAHQGN